MAREVLGLDIISWLAIVSGCALLAWAMFLDGRLERKAPGRYHHHSGGALMFAAAFWIGGLLRQPTPQPMTTATAALGVAGIAVMLLVLCGAMWWSDLDLKAASERTSSEQEGGGDGA